MAKYTFECLGCGWRTKKPIEADKFDTALQQGLSQHMKEGGSWDEEHGRGHCTEQSFKVRYTRVMQGEGTYFTVCAVCDWAGPVQASGPDQAKILGAIKHRHESSGCGSKEIMVDEITEEKFVG